MNVLIACEESQTVCKAFRANGHEAYSCDVLSCSGGHPEWHIKCDALKVLNPWFSESDLSYGIHFTTMDGKGHFVPGKWDLIIAFPPCTFLTVSGNRWFNVELYGDKAVQRLKEREKAIDFFMAFANSNCDHIAIENPIGVISSVWRKPDQIINPYEFGDPFEKKTCLWLKGLPLLVSTNIVKPPLRVQFDSGRSMSSWYANSWRMPPVVRARMRSKTFPGIAHAMADQWI